MTGTPTPALAEAARRADRETACWRDRFHLPRGADGEPLVYLCGNSLGLQPTGVRAAVEQELADWARLGVEGHFEATNPWYAYHEALAAPLARVVGALPGEVVAMNGLTVNLHLLLVSFYRPTATRFKLLALDGAFPSDRYTVDSQVQLHGRDPADAVVRVGPRPGEHLLRHEDVLAAIAEHGDSLATILLPGVHFYTGAALDIAAITAAGHAVGAMVGFDLAHAAGNLALRLHDDGVDFAAWCSYKYLNSGAGSVGWAFVHERHGRRPDLHRLAGWWGNEPSTRFSMPEVFVAQSGAAGWQLSNAPVLAMAPLRASLELFDEAGIDTLRARSERLTAFLLDGLDAVAAGAFEVITPRAPERRGCQLSLLFAGRGRPLHKALSPPPLVCDYREPDVIRVAPAPLYNTFADCARFVATVQRVLAAG